MSSVMEGQVVHTKPVCGPKINKSRFAHVLYSDIFAALTVFVLPSQLHFRGKHCISN